MGGKGGKSGGGEKKEMAKTKQTQMKGGSGKQEAEAG